MNEIFLLGGHDLEMLEVKRLLQRAGCDVRDAGLRWDNAELDAYSDVLQQNPEARFVGIELRDPHCLASNINYTLIDHHNHLEQLPAAILQVAAMVGVAADRRMLLVAANDSGYIPAMQALGATNQEVATIRREDRSAQGISDEDETLAELSIKKHLTRCGECIVVHSLTPHFSTICDRLFPYHSLLVYTDEEWVFYGNGKSEILHRMKAHIEAGRVYHGGGKQGYIGSVKKAFSPEEIITFVSSITQ